jgi:hypothetical protein
LDQRQGRTQRVYLVAASKPGMMYYLETRNGEDEETALHWGNRTYATDFRKLSVAEDQITRVVSRLGIDWTLSIVIEYGLPEGVERLLPDGV